MVLHIELSKDLFTGMTIEELQQIISYAQNEIAGRETPKVIPQHPSESKIINPKGTIGNLPKIYLYLESVFFLGNEINYAAYATAEDGKHLTGHTSSSIGWARHDMGFASDWKHSIYFEKYPDGFELIWLNENDANTILKEICKPKAENLNQP